MKSRIKTSIVVGVLMALMLSAPKAKGGTVECRIFRPTLNRFLDVIGPVEGRLGYYKVSLIYPCIPDVWNKCSKTLAEGWLEWRVTDNEFYIQDSGIQLFGTIRISWAGLSYTTSYTATVNMTFQKATGTLRLGIDSIHIAISFLGVSFGTLTFNIPYGMDVALGEIWLGRPVGGALWAQASGVTINPVGYVFPPDFIKIELNPIFR